MAHVTRLFGRALSLVALLAISGSVAAQPKKATSAKQDPRLAEAKRLFEEGADRYTKGDYQRAIEAWEMSYEISKKPLIFESIANAWERLGQPRQAHDALAKWRASAPNSEWSLLDERLRNLEARASRDEAAEANRKDEEAKTRRVVQDAATPDSPSKGLAFRAPSLVLMGAGGAAVVVGVTLDAIAASRRPDVASACRNLDGSSLCLSSYRTGIEASSRLAHVGDVFWIAGTLAVAGGVGLSVASRPKKSSETAVSAEIAPVAWPSWVGIAIRGRM
jgi:tetratricopeptide (TPR) repeat protein